MIRLIIFTAVFALFFINLYKPFSSEEWYDVSPFMFLVYSSCLILTGVLVVALSRMLMYNFTKHHALLYWHFGLWVVSEIAAMATIYTLYTVLLNPGKDILEAFSSAMVNTASVLLLPYFIAILYLSKRDKDKLLEKIRDRPESESESTASLVSFFDDRGILKFSIRKENFLLVESEDNYVCIKYLNGGKVRKTMLRNTLKNLEKQFAGTNVVRCHRSYMVNLDQVKVLRRGREGLFLELDIEGVADIPVSKTYSANINRWLSM